MHQRTHRTTGLGRALIHDVRFSSSFRNYNLWRVSPRARSWPSDRRHVALTGARRASDRAYSSVSFAGRAGSRLCDRWRSLSHRRFAGLLFRRLGPAAWTGSPRRWTFGSDVGDNSNSRLCNGTLCEGSVPHTAGDLRGARPPGFWVLLMAVWAALNLVFLGDDLFNLYVA